MIAKLHVAIGGSQRMRWPSGRSIDWTSVYIIGAIGAGVTANLKSPALLDIAPVIGAISRSASALAVR